MSPIEFLRYSLIFVHIIGLAAIIGSYILQMPWRRGFDFRPLLIGSIVSLVSGCALVAVHEVGDLHVDRWKITVKLSIAVIVLALAAVGWGRSRSFRRKSRDDASLRPILLITGIVAMANVAVALFWR
ncbi:MULTISPECIES: hypothetical protein [unclassified Microbacterium]|uniref:hypothetical protein n=1 Tax=unclassified Microbacterium TaxID=2609290 RepID=UPI00097EAA53|nr:hypothetical protein [Microbacterium sp. JB110]RCS60196.1 hypothetical protein CIK77_12450 [Microbacterium sp. JB110]SJM48256.1 hypothetical protein CZ774_03570 [Frigoribacterium sp. JB110]